MESTESLQDLLAENSTLILETGYRKPLTSATIEEKPALQKILRAHVLLRVKAEMDQFCEGLKTCGVLEAVTQYPKLMTQCYSVIVGWRPGEIARFWWLGLVHAIMTITELMLACHKVCPCTKINPGERNLLFTSSFFVRLF